MINTLQYARSLEVLEDQCIDEQLYRDILNEYYERIFQAYYDDECAIAYFDLTIQEADEMYKNKNECEILLNEIVERLKELN